MEDNNRGRVLRLADEAVNGDRNNQYGPPQQDFQRAAAALNSLGFRVLGKRGEVSLLRAHHVALIQVCVKCSRIIWSPEKEDHWVDLAGYAACGYECVAEESGDPFK